MLVEVLCCTGAGLMRTSLEELEIPLMIGGGLEKRKEEDPRKRLCLGLQKQCQSPRYSLGHIMQISVCMLAVLSFQCWAVLCIVLWTFGNAVA